MMTEEPAPSPSGLERSSVAPNSWLILAVGDDRQHGGNDGYDDQADVHYSWDSTVPNHAALQVGDAIAVWDKWQLIGTSVIEAIEEHGEPKTVYRCPRCGKSKIKARKELKPRYRCHDCGDKFEDPGVLLKTVKKYRSRHDAGWTDLQGVLDGAALRQLCVSPRSQLSLRPLRWHEFVSSLRAALGDGVAAQVTKRMPSDLLGGHVAATVRVRIGQARFRSRLIAEQGLSCAFTGPAPADVLEAGHLYSYAQIGVHHDNGGLLFRRDIHRLFDTGKLSINPQSFQIDVSPDLRPFSQYQGLHGQPLKVELSVGQLTWVRRHWDQHRATLVL